MSALENATVLVVGAGGGIGIALCEAFSLAGTRKVLKGLRQLSGAEDEVRIDLSDGASVQAAAKAHASRVDILVNAAGVNAGAGVLGLDALRAAKDEMRVNYFGSLALLQAFAPAMARRGSGCVVQVVSVLAHAALPAMGTYCASKAAMHSLTQSARAELAPHGVRVLGVYPPVVDTRMSLSASGPKLSVFELAAITVRAVADGTEEIYPGAAERMHQRLRSDPQLLVRELASRLPSATWLSETP